MTQDEFNDLLQQECVVDNDIDTCLISGEKLTEHRVDLTCGHSFNYIPLYKYANSVKQTSGRENIVCPYCQTRIPFILPYRNLPGVMRSKGVNYPPKCSIEYANSPVPPHLKAWGPCKSLLKSGARKGEQCNVLCYGKECVRHVTPI